jgi:hypothetical protein
VKKMRFAGRCCVLAGPQASGQIFGRHEKPPCHGGMGHHHGMPCRLCTIAVPGYTEAAAKSSPWLDIESPQQELPLEQKKKKFTDSVL